MDSKKELFSLFRGVLSNFGDKGTDFKPLEKEIKSTFNDLLKTRKMSFTVLDFTTKYGWTFSTPKGRNANLIIPTVTISDGRRSFKLQVYWGYLYDR